MKWIAANMGDLVDAYAEHVYWNYNDPGRLEYRLRDTAPLNGVLPPEERKPAYMIESGYAARHLRHEAGGANTYYAADPTCPEIWRTNIAGFQQFWFEVASAQLGSRDREVGRVLGVYDRTLNPPQVYWMTGPPTEGSPLTPTTTRWRCSSTRRSPVGRSSASTHGTRATGPCRRTGSRVTEQRQAREGARGLRRPDGELTILGLDTHGRASTSRLRDPPSQYSIGGLPPNTYVHPCRVERDRRRDELDRRNGHDERGRCRALRGAAPRSVRADDRAPFLSRPAFKPGCRAR